MTPDLMFINLRRYAYIRTMYLSAMLLFFLRRRVEHIRPFVGSSIYVFALCLIAWHVILGMTVKVFICEIIVKETTHGALVGRIL
jgi:hypothetical protein